jgi:hypothetical protein
MQQSGLHQERDPLPNEQRKERRVVDGPESVYFGREEIRHRRVTRVLEDGRQMKMNVVP